MQQAVHDLPHVLYCQVSLLLYKFLDIARSVLQNYVDVVESLEIFRPYDFNQLYYSPHPRSCPQDVQFPQYSPAVSGVFEYIRHPLDRDS
jgi:hypothetical protein